MNIDISCIHMDKHSHARSVKVAHFWSLLGRDIKAFSAPSLSPELPHTDTCWCAHLSPHALSLWVFKLRMAASCRGMKAAGRGFLKVESETVRRQGGKTWGVLTDVQLHTFLPLGRENRNGCHYSSSIISASFKPLFFSSQFCVPHIKKNPHLGGLT